MLVEGTSAMSKRAATAKWCVISAEFGEGIVLRASAANDDRRDARPRDVDVASKKNHRGTVRPRNEFDPGVTHCGSTERSARSMERTPSGLSLLHCLRCVQRKVSCVHWRVPTGYQALAYLSDLPVDCLALDWVFISGRTTPSMTSVS
jgi:hypothetical protein